MLFLLDRAEFAEASARKRSPFFAQDLFTAMAAEMWAIEHELRRNRIKGGAGVRTDG
jgi:hypothetical protein